MQVTGNNKNWQQARLTIRVSNNTLSFSVVDREAEHQVIYEPYTVKSGVSMAANLRQAFKESDLLQRGYSKVRVYIDTPVLIVPVEEFKEEDLATLYQHAFTKHGSDALHYRVQPSLNVVAIFPINKDLKLVVEDNFSNVRFTPILQPGTIFTSAVSQESDVSCLPISMTKRWISSVLKRTVSSSSIHSRHPTQRMPSIS